MSDTPRTDSQAFCRARAKGWIAPGKDAVSADFARQLERELAASQFALDASNGLRRLVMQERDELTKERDGARALMQAEQRGSYSSVVRELRMQLDESISCLREVIAEAASYYDDPRCPPRGKAMIARWRKAAGLEPQ